MFRKPRVQADLNHDSSPKPSTGRAPTPPSSTPKSSMYSLETSTSSSVPKPLLGRSPTIPRANTGTRSAVNKSKAKGNTSILSFFKKATPSTQSSLLKKEEDLLFLEEVPGAGNNTNPVQIPTPPEESIDIDSEDDLRYNESPHAFKRRRTDHQAIERAFNQAGDHSLTRKSSASSIVNGANGAISGSSLRPCSSESVTMAQDEAPLNGPFVDDPDSDDEMIKHMTLAAFGNTMEESLATNSTTQTIKGEEEDIKEEPSLSEAPIVPSLNREPTSMVETDEFDGIEDFIEDEFPEEGEEYMERLWMDQEGLLDLDTEDIEGAEDGGVVIKQEPMAEVDTTTESEEAETCPICAISFEGVSSSDVSLHVNNCLDGRPTPLPQRNSPPTMATTLTEMKRPPHKRFQRAAIARPGQQNPFMVSAAPKTNSSAFSKLMSSHAEDIAWTNAAAAENAARGKPAFQRTCPFYKIMPGFYICVDAFRYGAVQGCNAYFLSHFHSDHYIGLTSSWCHGPIYCSHVTANLVRRQLRVDPKWVVDLEFDQQFAVTGTEGVNVTMIPANHCPGSSLYLFEKVIGKGKNPKVQRILHCGDFRACPAHVQHPLLRPDLIDAVSGKIMGQQKLDVCYLDTTYLTPKYAFPSQEEVIKACADMCVSLSKEKVDETDDWEQTKKERAGNGMVKFVRKTSDLIKEEDGQDDMDAMKVNKRNGIKPRGRLLVICGTYSIGKERICLGIAKALNSKIYAPPNKQKICAALEDPELTSRMTSDPLEAQVHMQMIMEIRAETLADYLTGYKPHFSRIVGFRPSGWNYRPPNSRFVESPAVSTVLHSDNWKSRYSMAELVPQRGSTREASCFGVPYSEHSSFRELTMFCCALRIDKIIPTVNVGSAKSRERMKGWCEKWAMEKKKNGLFRVTDEAVAW